MNPLTATLEFVSTRLSGSIEVHSFVAETIACTSSWKQMCVREMAGYESNLSPHLRICLHNSILRHHRGTFPRCQDDRLLIFRQILDAVNCQEGLHNLIRCSLLTSDFVSVTLNFQGMSRGHQEKHPDDIVVLSNRVTSFMLRDYT